MKSKSGLITVETQTTDMRIVYVAMRTNEVPADEHRRMNFVEK